MKGYIETLIKDINLKELQELSWDLIDKTQVGLVFLNDSFEVLQKNELACKYFINQMTEEKKLIGAFLNCETLYESDALCGSKRQCRTCKLRNSLKTAFDYNRTLESIQITKTIVVDQKKYKKWIELTVSPMKIGIDKYLRLSIVDVTELINHKIENELSKLLID